MGGTATLGSNLVDELVGVADDIRRELFAGDNDLGVRQYVVKRVRRSWDGGAVGDGNVTTVYDEAIDPPPLLVEIDSKGVAREATPAGGEERGSLRLDEVSLSYTEAEIAPVDLPRGDEFYYRISDARGQGIAPRFFAVMGKAIPDRESSLGWKIPIARSITPVGEEFP